MCHGLEGWGMFAGVRLLNEATALGLFWLKPHVDGGLGFCDTPAT